MKSVVELKKITKTYQMGQQTHTVLHEIDCTINHGEMVAIMGPSGAGKSSLMNIIGLLDLPSQGEYTLNGQLVSNTPQNQLAAIRNEMLGFVFQSFYLLPRHSALDNVCLPLNYRRPRVHGIREQGLKMLDKVGLADKAKHKPMELSGGQQQRIALARALVGQPKVILADEPTGALDHQTSESIMDLFKQLNAEDNATVIIITHDPDVAAQCQRTIHLHDGRIKPC